MENSEALKILCEGESVYGEIYDTKVYISPSDIKENLRCNGHELDLEFIQDLTSVDEESGDFQMFQGHSLEEVTNLEF